MACVIAAPTSGSGKTLLSLVLTSWATQRNLKIQTFKIGPDYLDPQQLTAVSRRPCRNLDLILCGFNWVKETFYEFGGSADLTLVEGVMGLFDGIGSSDKGSTAAVARFLQLPIVLVVDARGQAASLAALVRGFRDQDPQLEIAGVVLNHINTLRHKALLEDVLTGIGVKVLGYLPNNSQLDLPSRHLGLAPAHEIQNLDKRIESWAAIAESYLDLTTFKTILQSPKRSSNSPIVQHITTENRSFHIPPPPIAIAEDKAFHFHYPETKEQLEKLGIPCISWRPIEDEPIPKQAKGLIIPGGFPEQYAEQLSHCSRSIEQLKNFFGQYPIYAECGGMLMLGQTLTDLSGKIYPMAGLLPFHARQGSLKVGYRNMSCTRNSLVSGIGDQLVGHEFHRWELRINQSELTHINITEKDSQRTSLKPLWDVKGWGVKQTQEGWGNKIFHASWIHLHWASSSKISKRWLAAMTPEASQKK